MSVLKALVSTVTMCVLTLAACVGHVHTPYEPTRAPPITGAVGVDSATLFDYPAHRVTATPVGAPERNVPGYRLSRLAIPSSGENGQPDDLVVADYYQSLRTQPSPLVIVLPIWGSHTYPPEKIAQTIVERSDGGISVLRVLGPDRLIDWHALRQAPDEETFVALAKAYSWRMQTTVIDIRRLVDWAQTQPGVEAEGIALIGFSVGALVGALVVASEPRLVAAVLVMGGANPDEIAVTCTGLASLTRMTITAQFDWTLAEYQGVVAEAFRDVNPARYGTRLHPRNLFMVDAHNDDCMPASSREALWEMLGRPERLSLHYGHKSSFLAMTPLGFNFLRGRIYAFLAQRLLTGKAADDAHYVQKALGVSSPTGTL